MAGPEIQARSLAHGDFEEGAGLACVPPLPGSSQIRQTPRRTFLGHIHADLHRGLDLLRQCILPHPEPPLAPEFLPQVQPLG